MPLVRIDEEPKSEGGLQLFYDTFGDSSKPALLLIMGLNAHMLLWHDGFCETLAARGFYVIRFDNRDMGLSTKLEHEPVPSTCSLVCMPSCCAPPPPYTLEDMAMDCVKLLDALKIQKAHIVGQSMGGMIAQLVAAEHPARVLTLTSVYSSPGNPDPSLKVKLRMAKEPKDDSREAFIENQLGMAQVCFVPEALWDEALLRDVFGRIYDRSQYRDGGFRQAAALIRQTPREDRVKSISCPVLIVHGKADVCVAFENAEWTQRLLPNARLLAIDEMGHSIMPPLYDRIADAIAELAKQAPAP